MLYIMRHGKTDWNAAYRLQGSRDISLNEEGREMARKAAKEYADIPLDICYVSPLTRAQETAEIFLEGRNIPVIVDDRLREMCFGEYEGIDHIFEKPELNIYKMFRDPAHYVPDRGAEGFDELYQRTGEFLEEVIAPDMAAGKNVIIIGHGAMNSSIISRYRGIPLEHFWDILCKNCEMLPGVSMGSLTGKDRANEYR